MARAHIPFTSVQASGTSRTQIEDFVRTLPFKEEFFRTAKLLREMGGRTSISETGNHNISLEVFADGDFEIYNSNITGPHYDTFQQTLMLAHYIMHFPEVKKLSPGHGMQIPTDTAHPHYPSEQARREAYWFTLEFLMPEAEMRSVFSEDGAMEKASIKFRASYNNIKARATQLDLVNKTQSA